MNIVLFLSILIALVLCISFFKSIKSNKKSKNSRSEILKWMEMTREQRHAMSEGEKQTSFKRKKRLLDQIRKEYAALDSKKNIT